MKSKLPAPTAKSINEAHQCAKESADNAVEWAMKCGQLLKEKKDEVGHGNFMQWVDKNCDFSGRVARKYMQVAEEAANQIGTSVPFSTMAQLLGYDKPKPKTDTPKGAVSVVKAPRKGAIATEETGADRPAASIPPPARASQPSGAEIRPEVRPAEHVDDTDEPERPDDIDEDAALAAAEADYMRRVDAVMQSDDKLAEAKAQLKQQAALIGTLEMTRDGYMRGKDAVTKLLQAEQRKVARLEKENKNLRERLGEGEHVAVNGGRHERPAVRA